MPSNKIEMTLRNILFYSSYLLLSWIFFILIFSNISFLCGFDLNAGTIVCSSVAGIVLLIFRGNNKVTLLVSVGIACVVTVLSYFLAVSYYDISYDGQGYHQETIYLLKNGWNPVYEQSNAFRNWVNYYQKGNEIIQANIYLLTNKIEAGKLVNLLFVYIAFVSSFAYLSLLRIKTVYRWLISFIIVFNPVVFTQVFTYYLDANWYLTFVILLMSLLSYFASGKLPFLIIFIFSSVIFCSLKLTSVPVFIVLSIFALIFSLKRKKLAAPLLSIFVLALICNAHPFITNIKNGHHILHPFAGEHKTDILNQNIPKVLLNHNRLERLAISLFSKPNNDREITLVNTLKMPFSIDKSHLFLIYDTRLGGFGYLFSEILILSFLLLFYSLYTEKSKSNRNIFLIIICGVICSILINPASWWARLSPQMWLVPIAVIIFALVTKKYYAKLLAHVCMFFLVLNIVLPGYLAYLDLKANQSKIQQLLDSAQNNVIILDMNNPHGFQQYHLKFEEQNINFKVGTVKSKTHLAPFTKDVYYEIQ